MRRWFLVVLAAATCIGFLTVSPAAGDVQTVLSEWPDWPTVGGAPRRTLCVHIKHNADFGAAVRQAMTNWNNANTGDNRWRFLETTDPNQADVSIEAASLPDTIAGLATAKFSGIWFWKKIKRVGVKIKSSLTGNDRLHTIMHELGHCMRMDDTKDSRDIMYGYWHSPPPTTPSTPASGSHTNDMDEAKASDVDPQCPLAVSTYIRQGTSQAVVITPKPGSGIDFADVVEISVLSLTGSDLSVVPGTVMWTATEVHATFTASSAASHNEVFAVRLFHASGRKDRWPIARDAMGGEAGCDHDFVTTYTGILTVTEDDAPAGKHPHAEAGSDIAVPAGMPVVLDGRGSHHDDPGVFVSGTWTVDDSVGVLGEYGELLLPSGIHTAVLTVKDDYGQVSQDAITVTVASRSGEADLQVGPEGVPSLSQNLPNPFNIETEIRYWLPCDCMVDLTIYNARGQKVKTLVDERRRAGENRASWDATDESEQELPAGVYFCRLRAAGYDEVRRVIFLK